MNYLILINEESKPVLVEVPQKPKHSYGASIKWEDEDYDKKVKRVLSDESKHIQFKDELHVKLYCHSLEYGAIPRAKLDLPIGKTYALPENISVSLINQWRHNSFAPWHDGQLSDGDNNLETRVVAILSPVVAPSEEVKLQEDGTNVIKTMGELNESIYKIQKNKPLTQPQVERVIEWMNGWEQLKDTAIPIRFKEDFS